MFERARREKTEADAKEVLRSIRGAEASFKARRRRFGSEAELLADGLLAQRPTEGAFRFEFTVGRDGYSVIAIPTVRDDRYQYVGTSFFLDESGYIRWAPYGKADGYRVAGKEDEPIPQSKGG